MNYPTKILGISAMALVSFGAVSMAQSVEPSKGGAEPSPSCSPEEDSGRLAKEATIKDLSKANNEFGFEIFQELHKDRKNTFISPTSIAMAMHMVTTGAKGKTLEQLTNSMHVGQMDLKELNKSMLADFAKRKGITLNVANCLWSDPERVTVNEKFENDLSEYFGSEVFKSSYSDPKSVVEINKWVAGNTNQMIPEILSEIPKDVVSYLINAVYFKGKWANSFDKKKTKDADFHLNAEEKETVKMMKLTSKLQYAEVDGTKVVRLPYMGEGLATEGKMAMWVVLPNAKTGLDDLVKELNSESFDSWVATAKKNGQKKGTVKMPKFEIRYKTSLKETLKTLGITSAFDEADADLSGVGSSKMGNIYINSVDHEAVVKVDEDGTEAAAVTSMSLGAKSAVRDPFEVTCDRPFLFVIRDDVSGSVLFVGTCYKPGK
ncbi:serpin family protein [Planctomycetota bacterium]|nr:serpin family protein [Planctomycetota bacterium]